MIIAVAVVAVLTLVWRRVEEAYFASEDSGWWPYLAAVFILAGLTWAGALRQPRSRRVVSVLAACGITVSTLGDVASYLSPEGSESGHLITESLWLLSLVLLTMAVWQVISSSMAPGARFGGVLDTCTIVVVSLLVFYSVTIHDRLVAVDASMQGVAAAITAAIPVVEAVILALGFRALTQRSGAHLVNGWFAAGIVSWLIADLGVNLWPDSPILLELTDMGYVAGSALIAVSVWTAPRTETARAATTRGDGRRQITALMVTAIAPLAVPPLLMLVHQLRGREVDPWEPLVGVLLLLLLAYLRILGLLRQLDRARTDLTVARDAAMEASRAKSAFIATTSHEIRTPMNGVIGLAGLLAGTDLDARQRQYAEGIRAAGESLLAIINDILDFARGEAGRVELETIDFSVVELIEDVVGLVAYSAHHKGLELLAYCSPELPTALRGDPTRLRQVLLNLAGNAVKFTDQGEVVVRAQLDGETGDGSLMVRFEVTDTGVGIDPSARERLFQPFSQADSSTTRRFGGTGLGLAICQQLVTSMGGQIGMDSAPGAGSTFWACVPLERAHGYIEAPPSPAALDGQRVLVVDDNATNRLMMQEYLQAWGLRPDLVADGPAALERLQACADAGDPYALLVLDLVMDGMDGLAVARRVNGDPVLQATPMVLLSSAVDVTHRELREAGITLNLTKPVPLGQLRSALANALSPQSTPAAGVPAPRAHPPTDSDTASAATSGGTHQAQRILVVEDDEVNQLVARGILEQLGYRVEVVDDGEDALAALGSARYDAVLMDCHMPGMDGYQTTGEWRRREGQGRRTPILAMTAGALDDDLARCLAAGMDDYLTKPVRKAELGAALQRWAPAAEPAPQAAPEA
ncbi:MAG: response regulator [Austwickia sp.]|nr:response regulator [Austwickia sp.]